MFKFLKSNLDKLSGYFGFPGQNLEEKLRRLLGISGACLTGPVLVAFGLVHLFRGDTLLGCFLAMGGLVFAISVLSIPRTRKGLIMLRICLAYAGCLFVYLLAVSGPQGHMAVWLYVYPSAVFFMLGIREGFLFNFLFLVAALFVLLFQNTLLHLDPIPPAFSVRFFISLVLVTFVAFFYEFAGRRYLKEIERNQRKLEVEKRNLTATKKMAEDANRAKSDFLANMSHELRTPLNHIIGFTELVVDGQAGDLSDVQKEYLGDVLGSSRHLLSLINDILDLSKVEAGKLQLEVGEVVLPTLLQNSLTMIKEKAMKHGIYLRMEIDGIPEHIRGDERKLKQILYNLLSNGVKFTPDGGTVTLAAGHVISRDHQWMKGDGCVGSIPFAPSGPGKWVEISIRDTGIGVKAEDLERIFAPFEQADNSSTRRYQGTGLGLSLTRQLVELHGGKIWAESEGEGKGSRFALVIPCNPPLHPTDAQDRDGE